MANIRDSLSHTKWLCKYHIVFTSKHRVVDVEKSYSVVRNYSTDFLIYYLGGDGLPLRLHFVASYPFS
jgi:putative transposase